MIVTYMLEKIEINLKNKEQIILFLNKIGHDSFTFCRTCGYVVKCEACDVAMTYHKGIDRLVCHYCGRTSKQVKICPNCHSKKIKEFGAGTEKLEQDVREIFKDARVMRMDSMVGGITCFKEACIGDIYDFVIKNAIFINSFEIIRLSSIIASISLIS